MTDLHIITKPVAEYEQKGKGGSCTTDQMPWMAFAERHMEVPEACRETVPLPCLPANQHQQEPP
ncbi:hypothetical protein B6S09_13130 [Oceanimonas baumannii]|uniref:Uncharacterized protein n=1 Tax=Oceanimonas baumannii TaxID=129578 RepID=A0A235CHC2_9GAMM|nr:hypothetical protein B6S09_13130 [Oceanimonas baumannii]